MTLVPYDYHLHSDFSCDCDIPMAAMCRAAIDHGLREIGFCEHFDLVPEDPCYASFRVEAWWQELQRCREQFADSLMIRAGIEAGEPHRFQPILAELMARHPWDYCVGALHWVGPKMIWDADYYDQLPDQAYRAYFAELEQAASCGGFDILAHLDVLKRRGAERYGPFHPERYEAEIRAVLRACARNDIAVEINTSTLRRSVRQTSPTLPVLTWFRQEGGRWLTLGSDAHLPEHVGFGLDQCLQLARAAGFEVVARFEQRRSIPHPIATAGVPD